MNPRAHRASPRAIQVNHAHPYKPRTKSSKGRLESRHLELSKAAILDFPTKDFETFGIWNEKMVPKPKNPSSNSRK